jgi:hypothetical protein
MAVNGHSPATLRIFFALINPESSAFAQTLLTGQALASQATMNLSPQFLNTEPLTSVLAIIESASHVGHC